MADNHFFFNGKQFIVENVADVITSGGTDGVTYSGFMVAGKYTAIIKISFKDSTPDEVYTFGGSSVLGMGSRGAAIKDYEAACRELYQAIGVHIVKEKVQKIVKGSTYKVTESTFKKDAHNWELRRDSIIYYRFLKEKAIQKAEFSRCVLVSPVFHVYTKSGKDLKQIITNDSFKNLCVPEILNLLYTQE